MSLTFCTVSFAQKRAELIHFLVGKARGRGLLPTKLCVLGARGAAPMGSTLHKNLNMGPIFIKKSLKRKKNPKTGLFLVVCDKILFEVYQDIIFQEKSLKCHPIMVDDPFLQQLLNYRIDNHF